MPKNKVDKRGRKISKREVEPISKSKMGEGKRKRDNWTIKTNSKCEVSERWGKIICQSHEIRWKSEVCEGRGEGRERIVVPVS